MKKILLILLITGNSLIFGSEIKQQTKITMSKLATMLFVEGGIMRPCEECLKKILDDPAINYNDRRLLLATYKTYTSIHKSRSVI